MPAHEISEWERLLSVATLGTRRATLNEQTAWPSDALAGAGSDASAELKLLRLVAATRLWNLAGARAAANATSSAPAPAEPHARRFATEAAAMRLARMVSGDHRDLIGEWFELARSADLCLPPQFVPMALNALQSSPPEAFATVVGPTGEWLAKLNSEWAITRAVQEPSEQRWHEGTLPERTAELTAMRKQDPSIARDWLQATWASDPPEAREAFVRVLGTRLSLADEAFLEGALDDKRKGVRQAAAEILMQLPDSAHAKRNLARLDPLIAFEEKKGLMAKLIKRKLLIELPTSPDKAAQRDGIEVKPPAQLKIGERAFWLRQMIAAAPPSHWVERFACTPETFVSAVLETEYADDVLPALTEAAARHPESTWLIALSEAWLASKQPAHVVAGAIAQLTQRASMEVRSNLLEALLQKLSGSKDEDTVHLLLSNLDFQLTPELTRAAIDSIARRARDELRQSQHNRNTLDRIANCCDVATAVDLTPKVLASIPSESAWRNALEQFNDIVEFRYAMKQELT